MPHPVFPEKPSPEIQKKQLQPIKAGVVFLTLYSAFSK